MGEIIGTRITDLRVRDMCILNRVITDFCPEVNHPLLSDGLYCANNLVGILGRTTTIALVAIDCYGYPVAFSLATKEANRQAHLEIPAVINQDFRRVGIGRKILNGMLGRLWGQGINWVYSYIRRDNEAGANFLLRNGFELSGRVCDPLVMASRHTKLRVAS